MLDNRDTVARWAAVNARYNRAREALNELPLGDERRQQKWNEIRQLMAEMEAMIPTAKYSPN